MRRFACTATITTAVYSTAGKSGAAAPCAGMAAPSTSRPSTGLRVRSQFNAPVSAKSLGYEYHVGQPLDLKGFGDDRALKAPPHSCDVVHVAYSEQINSATCEYVITYEHGMLQSALAIAFSGMA